MRNFRIASAYTGVFLTALLIGFLPLAFGVHALPSVHDEFSYLLASDTFAHGRLTNPPLPQAQYFQTFHELTSPTYASKYPPGQGLMLAAGQVFGDPIYGSIFTTAAACAAIVWMARGWLPLPWATLAGLLAALHPLIRFWTQSYWGGSLGMLGGALVAGAAFRAARRPTWTAAVALAAGVGVLINMRPLEGSIFTLLCLVYMAVTWFKAPVETNRAISFVIFSAVAFTPLASWTAYYNYRVTGSAVRSPYLVYAEKFQGVPSLFFQKPWPSNPDINPRIAYFRDAGDFAEYRQQLHLGGYLAATRKKLWDLATQWIGLNRLPLIIPVIGSMRSRKMRWGLALTLLPVLIHLTITPWFRWHYLSPAAGAFFILLALGARQMSLHRVGRYVLAMVIACAGWDMIGFVRAEISTPHPPGWARANLIEQIKRVPGKHVVVVTYTPGPQQIFEWVFNDADLNEQRVVFAFDRGPQTLIDLQQLFPGRRFWSLTVSNLTYALIPVSERSQPVP